MKFKASNACSLKLDYVNINLKHNGNEVADVECHYVRPGYNGRQNSTFQIYLTFTERQKRDESIKTDSYRTNET
jgi:hypothetical protein